jgi:lipopolysaccharide biosynthesis regulator YciM
MGEYLLVFVVLLAITIGLYLVWDRFFRKTSKPQSSGLYTEALRDLLDGLPESAFTKLRQVVTEDSTNLDAYLRLGRILREHNQPARALQVHKDLTLRRDLGRVAKLSILREITLDAMALKDSEMAEKALDEMISLDADNHWAHSQLLRTHEQAQRWDAAYDTAAKLLKLESGKSKKPLARYKLQAAEQLYRKREYHKARVLYKEAIGLDPTLERAYLAIGDSYYEEKRYEDAVTFWTKLISAVPDEGHRVIDRLKKTFFDLGRFGDIQGICEIILDHSPRNLEARLALAEFYEQKGDVDTAVELLERVVDDHPTETVGVLSLMSAYLERNDTRKLNELVRTLMRRFDDQKSQSTKSGESAPAAGSQA